MKRAKRIFVTLALLIFIGSLSLTNTTVYGEVTFTGQAGPPDHKLALWYRQPATDWESQALPIGNGRFGGMVFGGVAQDHIQFNEISVWTGNTTTRGSYQNFGDLYFDFSGLTTVSDYRRELDIEDAVARVRYNVGTTQYLREYFCSYPDNVMVMRFSSNASSNLNFAVQITNAHTGGSLTYSGNRITMSGTLTLLSYEVQVKVVNEGGTLTTGSDRITIANATAVTVVMACGTNYDPVASNYLGTGLHTRITNQVDTAAAKAFSTLKTSHLTDYQSLFNRVSLNLNDTKPTIPTDQLLSNYKGGTHDPALETLYFQYGRYLMLGCSREGIALPSNLQGLWCNSNTPSWQCDIHSNINVQMNYWPAEITNLSECHQPFLDYIYNEATLHTSWSSMASSLGCRGWTMKTQNNIFAYSDWNWNRPANAWYCTHLWQHYTFTLDNTFLSSKAYPVMKSACEFWIDRLITDTDGKLVAPDEWSPEQGPWENGVSYAQQFIWDLFSNTIKASEILNVDASFRGTLQTKLSQLDTGVRIGSWGQLREWKYTNDDQANTHRHISHLMCLYPGRQVSPRIDTQYSNAAKVSLNARGDSSTGWATAHRVNCWARLLDGNRALSIFRTYLLGGMTLSNLFDTHPPFQIDGNFGGTAGVAEMLLQSHLDKVELLPALPDGWPKGSVTGLCAKDAFEVSMQWDQKALKEATIKSKKGKTCTARNGLFTQAGQFDVRKVSDNSVVSYTVNGDTITFSTVAGESYKITSTYVPPTAPPSPTPTPIPAGVNAVLNKTATANAYWGTESPDKAVDGTTANNSKWCTDQNPGAQWLKVDIGQTCTMNRWVVKHAGAGGESATYNTKDFKLQRSSDGTNWTDVDTVTGNTANITDRNVTAFTDRYVRLYITVPTQTTGVHSRIYELEVYTSSAGPTATPTPTTTPTPTPTPTPTGAATATPTPTPATGVTFYQNYSYGGYAVTLAPGIYTTAQIQAAGITNNDVSSIKVPAGYTVTVYDSDNFSGSSWIFTADDSSFGDNGCNDKMSSVKIVAFDPVAYYKIVSRKSGKLMDVNGGSTADGATIIQWPDAGGTNQQWQFTGVSGGYYKIKNRNSGKLLEVTGGSTADGAVLDQWTDDGGNDQQWQVIDLGGGYFEILNRNSSKAADVEGGSTADGARIIQWPYGGATNQQWSFVKVP